MEKDKITNNPYIDKYVALINFITNINNDLSASIDFFDLSVKLELSSLDEKFSKIMQNTLNSHNELLNTYQEEVKQIEANINKSINKNLDFNKNCDISYNKKNNELNKSIQETKIELKKRFNDKINAYTIDNAYYYNLISEEQKFYEAKYGIADDLRFKYKEELNNTLDSFNKELNVLSTVHDEKIMELVAPFPKIESELLDELKSNKEEIMKSYGKEISKINHKIMKIKEDSSKRKTYYQNELKNKIQLAKDNLQSLIRINVSDQEEIINEYDKKINEAAFIEDTKAKDEAIKILEQEKSQKLMALFAKKELLGKLNDLKIEKENKTFTYLINLNAAYSEVLILEAEKMALIARTNKDFQLKKAEMLIDYKLEEKKRIAKLNEEYIKIDYEHQKKQIELNKTIALKQKEIEDIKIMLNVKNYENLKDLNISLYEFTIESFAKEKIYHEKIYNQELDLLDERKNLQNEIIDLNTKIKKLKSKKVYESEIKKQELLKNKLKAILKFEKFKLESEKNKSIHLLSIEEIDFIHTLLDEPFQKYFDKAATIIKKVIDFCENLTINQSNLLINCLNLMIEYFNVSKQKSSLLIDSELKYQIANYEKRINQLTQEKYDKIVIDNEKNYNAEIEQSKEVIKRYNNKIDNLNKDVSTINESIVTLEQAIFESEQSLETLLSLNKDNDTLYHDTSINYKRLIKIKRKELKRKHKKIFSIKQEIEKIKLSIISENNNLEKIEKKYNKIRTVAEKNKIHFVITYYKSIEKIKIYSNKIKKYLDLSFDKIFKILENEIVKFQNKKSNLERITKLDKNITEILKNQNLAIINKNKKERAISLKIYNKSLRKEKIEYKKNLNKKNVSLVNYELICKNSRHELAFNVKEEIKQLEKNIYKIKSLINNNTSKLNNLNLSYMKPYQDEQWYKLYLSYLEKKKSINENEDALIKDAQKQIKSSFEELLTNTENANKNKESLEKKPLNAPNIEDLKKINSLKVKNLIMDVNQKISKIESNITVLKINEKNQNLEYTHNVKSLKDAYKSRYLSK